MSLYPSDFIKMKSWEEPVRGKNPYLHFNHENMRTEANGTLTLQISLQSTFEKKTSATKANDIQGL